MTLSGHSPQGLQLPYLEDMQRMMHKIKDAEPDSGSQLMAGIVYYSQEKYFHQLQQAAAVGLEKFSKDPVLQFFKAYGVLREERIQDAIRSLERIRSHPDVSLCSTAALIYAHKNCEVTGECGWRQRHSLLGCRRQCTPLAPSAVGQ
ncbi:hypothetical protein MC885_006115 [Smutsia gigantea]|nr:hypothetical protein MC885_006115 [Smutsia gigantea]